MIRPMQGRCEQCHDECKGYGRLMVIGGRWLCRECYDTEEASLQSRKSISSRQWRIRWDP